MTQAAQRRLNCVIVSGDLDLLQLANPHCTVVVTRRGISEMTRYDVAAVHERYGLAPEQLPDFRGLKGDPSDNLPGVPGIGEKTAAKLIAQYGSLDALLANLATVTPKRVAELLREHADQARRCRDVSLAKRELAIVPEWERWRFAPPTPERLAELYRALEFKSLLAKVSTPAFSAATGSAGNGLASEVGPEFIAGSYRRLEDDDAILAALRQAQAAARIAIVLLPLPRTWRNADIAAIALAWQAEQAVVFAAARVLQADAVAAEFAKLLEAATPAKIVYGLKNLRGWLDRHGLPLRGVALDVQLAAGVLDPTRGEPSFEDALIGTPAYGATLPVQPVAVAVSLFAEPPKLEASFAAPADALFRAHDALQASVAEAEMDRVLLEIEQPLAPVLARMEAAGFRLDLDELQRIRHSLEVVIGQTTADIYRLADEEFNLNSPKVVGHDPVRETGLAGRHRRRRAATRRASRCWRRSRSSTRSPPSCSQYREVSKLKSTYVDALPALIDERTALAAHDAAPARARRPDGCRAPIPNLQNIPVRTEVGRAIRRAFLPATPGNVLLAADYSQIELRLFAHMSGDDEFIAAFQRGDDIHAYTARAVFGVARRRADQRRTAPPREGGELRHPVRHGRLRSGAKRPGSRAPEAREFIAALLRALSAASSIHRRRARRRRATDGYVTTLLGRRRYLPDLRSHIYPLRAAAERMAINAPLQGSAADLIKLAMVEVAQPYRGARAGGASAVAGARRADLRRCRLTRSRRVRDEVKDAMENAMQLRVPLVVDFKAGPNWAEAEAMA